MSITEAVVSASVVKSSEVSSWPERCYLSCRTRRSFPRRYALGVIWSCFHGPRVKLVWATQRVYILYIMYIYIYIFIYMYIYIIYIIPFWGEALDIFGGLFLH